MNNSRKVTLLYQKAHGQSVDASPEERRELKKYRVSSGDSKLATRANVSAYVKAVDGGYCLSFYDWCLNHHKADRRRKGSSEKEMSRENLSDGIGAMLFGWLTWGIAIYWMCHGRMEVNSCAIAGAIVSFILVRISRRQMAFTLFLLPLILAAYFGN